MSQPQSEVERLAVRLVERARADQVSVRALVENADGIDEIAGFHAQQAVEKCLKAALVLRGEDPPRTHDLVFLVEALAVVGVTAPLSKGDAAALYPYAVELRYEKVSAASAVATAKMIALADAAVAWIEGRLPAMPT
jgi:HEPN domain-containing protein